MTLEKGVRLKGTKNRAGLAFNEEELLAMHQAFETKRIEKAQAMLGNRVIKKDHLCKFIVDRTNFCPHKLVDANTSYWLETVILLDGEQGLTLPAPMHEIPLVFFDALSIVRSARAQARKEDK